MDKLHILCGEPRNYSKRGLERAGELGRLTASDLGQDAFEKAAADADVVMVRLQLKVTPELLASSPGLQAIITPTTGLNHIDLEECKRRGIKVFHLRGETDFLRTITSTAEHTFGLLLALVRNTVPSSADVSAGHWQQLPFRGRELKGKRLGILGHGRLGSIVARYGRAFDMTVHVYDPFVHDLPDHIEQYESIEGLMAHSDILSVHVPLNDTTRHLVTGDLLEQLPAGAFVVNTSRGEIVDESSVVEALTSGHLAGYATDVLAGEHALTEKGHPLIDMMKEGSANVLITPHIGGAAEEAIEQTDLFLLDKLAAWIRSLES